MPKGVYKRSEKHLALMRVMNKGRKFSKEWRRNLSKSRLGNKNRLNIPHSIEVRKKISNSLKGENAPNWQGGINSINDTIRKSIEYRLWRESVFARDNWICQKCLERGGKLHAHHIKNFSDYPELRFAIDNGITFCKRCHNKFHRNFGKKNNTKIQLDNFLKNEKSIIGRHRDIA